MTFQFHPEARREYREAIIFYGRAGERFVEAVDAAIASILRNPERFRELKFAGALAGRHAVKGAYVTDAGSHNVSVSNTATRAVIATVTPAKRRRDLGVYNQWAI